ncbi:hypothetical protein Fcan01_26697 [Folsomia candida]|uniref:BTB domain-containing protein n=1 Tax=Folsomia candida TaxID=158441 RepID=A0A226D0W9_FOLCA|nr:hypothetical protein Fcan01_26697 [Folsomia candida]
MFATKMKEKEDSVVELADLSGPALKIFLKFIYIAELDETWGEYCGEVVYAASKKSGIKLLDIFDVSTFDLVYTNHESSCVKTMSISEIPKLRSFITNFDMKVRLNLIWSKPLVPGEGTPGCSSDRCDVLLPTLITWENCFQLLEVASLHSLAASKQKIEAFMECDPTKLMTLVKGFVGRPQSHPII